MATLKIPTGTTKIFHFEDNGQDFLHWYVDKNGKVLEAWPFQTSVWKDSIVGPHVMEVGEAGDNMDYIFKDGSYNTLKHKIERIENL